jgi:hypothetical protein
MDTRRAVTAPTLPAAAISTNESAVLAANNAAVLGTVDEVLHPSRIVQIVRLEKIRLPDDDARGC